MRIHISHCTHLYYGHVFIFIPSIRTILYEMITRKFPFTCDRLGFAYEYETVIFMVGHGTRQEFKMTDVPRKLKVHDKISVCSSLLGLVNI